MTAMLILAFIAGFATGVYSEHRARIYFQNKKEDK